MSLHGKVPMFRMKPRVGTLVMAGVMLILDLAFFLEAHSDPGNLPAHHRSRLILTVSIILSGLLFIVATGRMWFGHLWHDLYR